MKTVITCLQIANYVAGTLVVILSLVGYFCSGSLAALYIALAILVVGPLEDLVAFLITRSNLSEAEKKQYSSINDYVTSLAFLIFLGLVLQNIL